MRDATGELKNAKGSEEEMTRSVREVSFEFSNDVGGVGHAASLTNWGVFPL